MGPYTTTWTAPTLDEQIAIKESMIQTGMQVLKRDEEDLAALKERKRIEDLDAENKRLKAENSRQAMLLSDQTAKIERLKAQWADVTAQKRAEYTRGYRNGFDDGLLAY